MDPTKLEFYIIGILKKKGPCSARKLFSIFQQSTGTIFQTERKPSEEELLATLAHLEGSQKIICGKKGTWAAIGINPKLPHPILSKPISKSSPQPEIIRFSENPIEPLVPTPIVEVKIDEKPKTNEFPTKTNFSLPNQQGLIPIFLKCPNPKCSKFSHYLPKIDQPKRSRRRCKYCGMKTEIKFWIPAAADLIDHLDQTKDQAKDQSSLPSEKPYEKPRTKDPKDQSRIQPPKSVLVQGINDSKDQAKDQSSLPSEKPYEKPRTKDPSKDQKTTIPENVVGDFLVEKILDYLIHGSYPSQIAADLHLSPATIHRKIKHLMAAGLIEEKPTYPKTYSLIPIDLPKSDLPAYIRPRLSEIHNAGIYVPLLPIFNRDPKKLWEKECADATKISRVGRGSWSKYIYDPRDRTTLYDELGPYKIEINKYTAIFTYLDKLSGKYPKDVIENARQRIPIEFIKKRGIPCAPEKAYFGQGDIVVQTGNAAIDGVGTNAVIQVKSGEVLLFKNDDSKKDHREGIEFTKDTINQAQNLVMMGDRMEKLDKIDQLHEQLDRIEKKTDQTNAHVISNDDKIDRLTDVLGRSLNVLEELKHEKQQTPPPPPPTVYSNSDLSYFI